MIPYTSPEFPDGLPWLEVRQLPEVISTTPSTSDLLRHIGLPSSDSWKQLATMSPSPPAVFSMTYSQARNIIGKNTHISEYGDRSRTGELKIIDEADVPEIVGKLPSLPPGVGGKMQEALKLYCNDTNVTTILATSGDNFIFIAMRRSIRVKDNLVEYYALPHILAGKGNLATIFLMSCLQLQLMADIECLVNSSWLSSTPISINLILHAPPADQNQMSRLCAGIMRLGAIQIFGAQRERIPENAPRYQIKIEGPAIDPSGYLPVGAIAAPQ